MRLAILCLFTMMVVAFQNCGKVNFAKGPQSLSGENVPTGDGTQTPPQPTGEGGGTLPNVPPPTVPGESGGSTPPGSGGSGEGSSSALVECELGSPNARIILSGNFLVGSNASATRVCMSSTACLGLVNSYAEVRGCTLNAGSPTTLGLSTSCTGVFPGSQGTCHNAQALSDAQVVNILANMAK